MWKRRLVVCVALALGLGIAAAFIIPDSRYRILAFLRQEPLVDGRPVEYWLALLKDGDAADRRRAAINLGETGLCSESTKQDAECVRLTEALVDALGDDDGFVRKCAATSLLLLPKETPIAGERGRIECMLLALSDREVAVRRAAVRGLWQAGASAKQADGVTRLTAALTDMDEFVRMYAARALAKIGPDAGAAVPALIERVRQDEDTYVKKLAAKALGLIGPNAVGASLPEATKALAQSLAAKDAGLREYAARALGELGSVQAIPALRQVSQDSDQHVREAAAAALKLLESKKSP